MNEQQRQILGLLSNPPARLTPEQVAAVLNCQPYDIPILINAKLLTPLGEPRNNSTRFIAAADIRQLIQDTAWLHRVTRVLQNHWRQKNQSRARKTGL